MNTLFPIPDQPTQIGERSLDQYFTPEWAAEALVSELFADLSRDDFVVEPSCGRGAFLKAIPDDVPAIGVELDEQLAREARENSGREVLCGDFRVLELPEQPTAIVGNPPFKMKLINQFLARAHELLPDNGRCGFILPSYAIQTPRTVLRWSDDWSLDSRILPRTLFTRAIRPLVFLMFTKDRVRRVMGGFSLYREAMDINSMPGQAKLLLIHGKPRLPCWRAVVDFALGKFGGRARLDEIYHVVGPRRPTDNPWWKEKVRQTLQRHFDSVERGVWQRRAA